MKIKRSTLIPILLLIYLAVMSIFFGWPAYRSGQFTATYYFGSIVGTLVIIAVLHFFMKKREKMRSAREDDIARNSGNQSDKI